MAKARRRAGAEARRREIDGEGNPFPTGRHPGPGAGIAALGHQPAPG